MIILIALAILAVVFTIIGISIFKKIKYDLKKLQNHNESLERALEDVVEPILDGEKRAIEYLTAAEINALHKTGAVTIYRDGLPVTIMSSDKWRKQ